MKAKITDIKDMGIISILSAVLGNTEFDNLSDGSAEKSIKGEVPRGIISFPASRRLFAASTILTDRISELEKSHDTFHTLGQVDEANCREYAETIISLTERMNLLNGLLWLSVAEQYPQVMFCKTAIKNGWEIFSRDKEWDNIPLTPSGSNPMSDFMDRLRVIVCGRDFSLQDEKFEDLKLGEEVIGFVQDERIKALRALISALKDAMIKQLPDGSLPVGKSLDEMKVGEIRRLTALGIHFKKLSETINPLFWRAVRDTVPETKGVDRIAIRQDWNVVRCPTPEDAFPELEVLLRSIMSVR